MGRSQIFEAIYSALSTDTQLIPLLGGQTATNLRVYRNFPQLQSFLAGPPIYEPRTTEGWLVIEETPPGLMTSRAQYDSIYEVLDLACHIYATTYGLGDDVADILDSYWHWQVEQQRDIQYGDYYVFFTRAFQSYEEYAQPIKLPHKIRQYRLELVKAEQPA